MVLSLSGIGSWCSVVGTWEVVYVGLFILSFPNISNEPKSVSSSTRFLMKNGTHFYSFYIPWWGLYFIKHQVVYVIFWIKSLDMKTDQNRTGHFGPKLVTKWPLYRLISRCHRILKLSFLRPFWNTDYFIPKLSATLAKGHFWTSF